jgi:predicted MFS family arabinose efflux permease
MQDPRFDARAPLAAAIGLAMVGATIFVIQPLFLGTLMAERGFSAAQVGALAAMELGASTVSGIVAVVWITRWSWRVVAAVALLVSIAGNALSTQIADYTLLAGVRIVTAFFGISVAYVLGVTALGRSSRPERNFSLAVVGQVGFGALALFMGPLLTDRFGVAGVLAPAIALPAVVLALVRHLPRGRPASAASLPLPGARGSTSALTLLAVQVLWYVGLGAVWAFSERIGTDAGLDGATIGQALSVGMVASIAGSLTAMRLGIRFGREWPFALAVIAQAGSMLLFLLAAQEGLFFAAAVLFNLTWNFALPYLLGAIAVADASGRLTALVPAAQGLGLGLGPAVGGMLFDGHGIAAVVMMAGALNCAATMLYLLRQPRPRRR